MTFIRKAGILCTTAIFATMTLGTLLGTALAANYTQGDITVSDPWSRATPPSAKVAGGYMEITNKGTEADRLVTVSSSIAPRIEVHEMAVENNVMKMRKLSDGAEIPAGGSLSLKPGGYHVMFFDFKEPFKEGETFDAELKFEKAGTVKVKFDIKSMGTRDNKDAHSGH